MGKAKRNPSDAVCEGDGFRFALPIFLLPDGQISKLLSSPAAKNILLHPSGNREAAAYWIPACAGDGSVVRAGLSTPLRGAKRRSNPFFLCAARWIASLALAMTVCPHGPHPQKFQASR